MSLKTGDAEDFMSLDGDGDSDAPFEDMDDGGAVPWMMWKILTNCAVTSMFNPS